MKAMIYNAIKKNLGITDEAEEILAEFFGVNVEEVRVWSDGSMTIDSKCDSIDYYVEEEEVEGYSVIGRVGKMLIQSNG